MHKNLIKTVCTFFILWNFLLPANCLSSPSPLLEIFTDSSLTIPKTVYSQNDFSLSTFNFIYGAKLTAGPFDIRFYQSTGNIKLSEFGSPPQNNPAWSVKTSLNAAPLSFYAGTLGTSQTASRLRTPSFYSNPSPTATPPNTDYGLGIQAAQKSASSKPVALGFVLKKSSYTLEALLNENQDLYACCGLKTQIGDFIKTDLSLSFANFYLAPKSHTEWKNTTLTYEPQRESALFLETLFSMPLFKLKAYGGFIQNPFNTLRFFGAGEIFFHYAGFSVDGGFYCSDTAFLKDSEPFYTVSQNLEKSLYQIKLNPQFKILSKEGSIKTGICAFYDKTKDESGYRENFTQKLTVSAGTELNSKNDRLSFLYKLQMTDSTDQMVHTATVSFKHWFKDFAFLVTFKEAVTTDSALDKIPHTETINIALKPKNCPITQAAFALSAEHKNSCVNAKLNCGISGNIIVKNVKIIGKIQVYTVLVVE